MLSIPALSARLRPVLATLAVVLAATALGGCGPSPEEIARKKAEEQAAADKKQRAELTTQARARHDKDCDNLFKASYAAEAGQAMGRAMRDFSVYSSASDLKETADAKLKECEARTRDTIEREVNAIMDWSRRRTEIIAQGQALLAKKDWRGARALYERYSVNRDQALHDLLMRSFDVEKESDREFAERTEESQYGLMARDVQDMKALAQVVYGVGSNDAALLQERAPGWFSCMAASAQVDKVREAIKPRRIAAELDNASNGRINACTEAVRKVCAGPNPPSACAPLPESVAMAKDLKADPEQVARATECSKSEGCMNYVRLAFAYCQAGVHHRMQHASAEMLKAHEIVVTESLMATGIKPTPEPAVYETMRLAGMQAAHRAYREILAEAMDPEDKRIPAACDNRLEANAVLQAYVKDNMARLKASTFTPPAKTAAAPTASPAAN